MSKALQANQGQPPLKSRRKENTKYLDSLEQAQSAAEFIIFKALDKIHLKELEKFIKPSAQIYSKYQLTQMLQNCTQFYDKKMDDQYIIEEQKEIAVPPLSLSIISPILTNQVQACNDFEPLSNDTYKQAIARDKIPRPESSCGLNQKSDFSVDSANGFRSSNKLERVPIKRASTIYVQSNAKNKKQNQYNMQVIDDKKGNQIPLKLEKLNQDSQKEGMVEKLRAKIIKKEALEKEKIRELELINKQKTDQNKEDNQQKLKEKNKNALKEKTYDSQGQVIFINNFKPDNLPNLQGQQLSVKEASTEQVSQKKVPATPSENIKILNNLGKPPINPKQGSDIQLKKSSQINSGSLNENSNKTLAKAQESFNPLEQKNQIVTGINLNIKSNMKAGPGVVFVEGKEYKDVGPQYKELQSQRVKISMQEYREKYQPSNNNENRINNYMNYKKNNKKFAKNDGNEFSEIDQATLRSFEDQNTMTMQELQSMGGIQSTLDVKNDRNKFKKIITPDGIQIFIQKEERSQIRIHSTKGQRDLIEGAQGSTIGSGAHTSQFKTFNSSMLGQNFEDANFMHKQSQLPAISNKNNSRAQSKQFGGTGFEQNEMKSQMSNRQQVVTPHLRLQSQAWVQEDNRAIKTANIRMRHGSTRNDDGRVITSGHELRIQQKKIDTFIQQSTINNNKNDGQSDHNTAKFINHRNLVALNQDREMQTESQLAAFVQEINKGKVQSHIGDRQKYQRLISKNLKARDFISRDFKSAKSTQMNTDNNELKSKQVSLKEYNHIQIN